MARTTYVFDTNPDGSYVQPLRMVEKAKRKYPFRHLIRDKGSHMVIEDIQPYQSTIDGSTISSRSKHRAHLRQHGCEEIGTESIERASTYFKKPGHPGTKDVVEDVRRAMDRAH